MEVRHWRGAVPSDRVSAYGSHASSPRERGRNNASWTDDDTHRAAVLAAIAAPRVLRVEHLRDLHLAVAGRVQINIPVLPDNDSVISF
jgi:hypothetical protein